MISSSLIVSRQWQLTCFVWIQRLKPGYHEYQFFGIILWQMEIYFVNKKWEFIRSTVHGYISRYDQRYHSCKLLGTYLRNIFPSILLIFMWGSIDTPLYVKIWMVKIWWIFDRSSISPNFSSAKVSLHKVCILIGQNGNYTIYVHVVVNYWL